MTKTSTTQGTTIGQRRRGRSGVLLVVALVAALVGQAALPAGADDPYDRSVDLLLYDYSIEDADSEEFIPTQYGVARADGTGGDQRVLREPEESTVSAVWSPDGRSVALTEVSGGPVVRVVDRDGQSSRTVFAGAEDWTGLSPAQWLPDASGLVLGHAYWRDGWEHSEIVHIDLDTGVVRVVADSGDGLEDFPVFAVAPDGSAVMVHSGVPEGTRHTLVDLGSGQVTALGIYESAEPAPNWSSIATVERHGEGWDATLVLSLRDLQTGAVIRELFTTSTQLVDSVFASWAPDSEHLSVAVTGASTRLLIYRTDGSRLRELDHVPGGEMRTGPGSWSPDATRLLFATSADAIPGDHNGLYSWDPFADRLVKLAHWVQLRSGGLGMNAWAPDGTYVVMESGRGGLATVGADGRGLEVLDVPASAEYPRFAPRAVTTFPDPHGRQAATVRWAGPDRFATAARISEQAFAPGAPVAFVATGATFADAVTGGAAAAVAGGPVLLTTRDSLPAPTRAELQRLRPGRIEVLGGTAAVGDGVFDELRGLTSGAVRRIAGPDRYATAAAIADAWFIQRDPPRDEPLRRVLLATGENFPDALAGGVFAALSDAPVLLTGRSRLPDATRAQIERLRDGAPPDISGTSLYVMVLGGPGAVSDAVLDELDADPRVAVNRVAAGTDRFATATQVANLLEPRPARVFVATGMNFPDSLAGVPAAANAGVSGVPVLLVTRDTVPESTRGWLRDVRPLEIVVLGGPGVVSDAVLAELRALADDRASP